MRHAQNNGKFPETITYEEYCDVRKCYNNNSNEYEDYYIGLVGFLASYNGRFFDGGFAKSTDKRDYYQEKLRNLLSQNLSDIQFMINDYHYFESYKNCLFYCDPPYANTKQYNNRIYFNSNEFFDFARKLSQHNIVLISEQSAPNDFECIWKQDVKRQIDASNKFDVCEKLFIIKNGIKPIIPEKRGLF